MHEHGRHNFRVSHFVTLNAERERSKIADAQRKCYFQETFTVFNVTGYSKTCRHTTKIYLLTLGSETKCLLKSNNHTYNTKLLKFTSFLFPVEFEWTLCKTTQYTERQLIKDRTYVRKNKGCVYVLAAQQKLVFYFTR
jgi:hypothetical protein